MKIRIPYLVEKPGAGGPRYFWQPSAELRALGWKSERLRRADGSPITTLDEAADLARARNAELEKWRRGESTAPAAPPKVEPHTVAHVIRLYLASPKFTAKAAKTQYEYRLNLRQIEDWAGDAPVKALDRATVQEYYASLMATGKHAKANALIRMLRILLKFAWDNGFVRENAAEKPGLVGTAPRLRLWSDAEITAFVSAADAAGWPSVGDAVVYGCYLGQRQGDLLAMKHVNIRWDAARNIWRLHLQQNKTGRLVGPRFAAPAAARYEAARARTEAAGVKAPTVLWNEGTKKPWDADTFRHVFGDIRARVASSLPSIADAWFMDTRDTAITKLAHSGCTIPEICAISGHDEDSATRILKHYLVRTGDLADTAIDKLEAYELALRRLGGQEQPVTGTGTND